MRQVELLMLTTQLEMNLTDNTDIADYAIVQTEGTRRLRRRFSNLTMSAFVKTLLGIPANSPHAGNWTGRSVEALSIDR